MDEFDCDVCATKYRRMEDEIDGWTDQERFHFVMTGQGIPDKYQCHNYALFCVEMRKWASRLLATSSWYENLTQTLEKSNNLQTEDKAKDYIDKSVRWEAGLPKIPTARMIVASGALLIIQSLLESYVSCLPRDVSSYGDILPMLTPSQIAKMVSLTHLLIRNACNPNFRLDINGLTYVPASQTCYAGYAPGQMIVMALPTLSRDPKKPVGKTYNFLELKRSQAMMTKFKEYLSVGMMRPQADLLLVTINGMALNGEDDQTILRYLDRIGLQYTKQSRMVYDERLIATMSEGDFPHNEKYCTVVSDSRTLVRDSIAGQCSVKVGYDDPFFVLKKDRKQSTSLIFYDMLARMPEHLIEEYVKLVPEGGVLAFYDTDPRFVSDALAKVKLMIEGLCNQEQTQTSYALRDHQLRPYEEWVRFFVNRGFISVYEEEIKAEQGTYHVIMVRPKQTLGGLETYYTGLANRPKNPRVKYHGYCIYEESEVESLLEDSQDF